MLKRINFPPAQLRPSGYHNNESKTSEPISFSDNDSLSQQYSDDFESSDNESVNSVSSHTIDDNNEINDQAKEISELNILMCAYQEVASQLLQYTQVTLPIPLDPTVVIKKSILAQHVSDQSKIIPAGKRYLLSDISEEESPVKQPKLKLLSSPDLLSLPLDLIKIEFSNFSNPRMLQPKDLLTLRLVSKKYRDYFSSEAFWEYLMKKWFPLEYRVLELTSPDFKHWLSYFFDRWRKVKKYYPEKTFLGYVLSQGQWTKFITALLAVDSQDFDNRKIQYMNWATSLNKWFYEIRYSHARGIYECDHKLNQIACYYYYCGLFIQYFYFIDNSLQGLLNISNVYEATLDIRPFAANDLSELFPSPWRPSSNNPETIREKICHTDNPQVIAHEWRGASLSVELHKCEQLQLWQLMRNILNCAALQNFGNRRNYIFKPTGLYFYETCTAYEWTALLNIYTAYELSSIHLKLYLEKVKPDQNTKNIIRDILIPTIENFSELLHIADANFWFLIVIERNCDLRLLLKCMEHGALNRPVHFNNNGVTKDILFEILDRFLRFESLDGFLHPLHYPWKTYFNYCIYPLDYKRYSSQFFIQLISYGKKIGSNHYLMQPIVELIRMLKEHGVVTRLPRLSEILQKFGDINELLNNSQVLLQLLLRGAEISPVDRHHIFWVELAYIHSTVLMSQNRLEFITNFDIADNDGNTLAHKFAKDKIIELLKELFARGANFTLINRDGKSVWDLIPTTFHTEIRNVKIKDCKTNLFNQHCNQVQQRLMQAYLFVSDVLVRIQPNVTLPLSSSVLITDHSTPMSLPVPVFSLNRPAQSSASQLTETTSLVQPLINTGIFRMSASSHDQAIQAMDVANKSWSKPASPSQ